MSQYNIGDLIFDELDRTNRLEADGSYLRADAYPELAALMGTVTEAPREWPKIPITFSHGGMAGGNVKFSPDGSRLYIATQASERKLVAYSTDTWTEIPGVSDNLDYAYWVEVSPDGRYLAVRELSARIKIVDTEDWSAISVDAGIYYNLNTFAFSPDGNYLAVGVSSHDGGLLVLNATDWSVVPNTPVLARAGDELAFSPDGEHLVVSQRNDSTFEILSTASWSRVAVGTSVRVKRFAFSPCGAFLAVLTIESPFLRVYNTSDWSLVPGVPSPGRDCSSISWSADGKYLAMVPYSTTKIVVIETSTWTTVSMTKGSFAGGDSRGCDFSPDGKYLAVAHATAPSLSVFYTPMGPFPEYFTLPDVRENPVVPGLPVLIQVKEDE